MTEEGTSTDNVGSPGSPGDSEDGMVKIYEEMFADRYSSNDDSYQDVLQSSKAPPPCVKNWFPKQNRNYDRNRGRGGRGYHQHSQHGNYGNRNYGNQSRGGYDNDRHYHGHRDQSHYDRHQGQGQWRHGSQRHDRRYQPY
ncbi:RNA guanine-N7 methyltransferase activating subunit-like [Ylistrum balloti]|uniref:RNA guanine-N7 methyltransferase activating subunit-like n=1 Tax=Ylistrum balloti TaxID=509963 RepID=UPI002905F4B1|nr:RNA guanine-N7 methyltransferase activating subunit-like [Ylistrum balloti]XP_060081910.1 RNA guanine-N7 methyltransferase activating subunit-like [Ylistrum balloti]XP_060081911.1 RNA guanine-N7 methyltransferase activating subunit-like [Ylistrum balloti]